MKMVEPGLVSDVVCRIICLVEAVSGALVYVY